MVSAEEVKKPARTHGVQVGGLAALVRISVGEEELPKFTKEFEAILAYVGQLEKLDLPKDLKTTPGLRNVFRADEDPTPAGEWTEKLVAAFPEKEGNALVVKQIISHE